MRSPAARIARMLVLLALMASGGSSAGADTPSEAVGVRSFAAPAPERGIPVAVSLWYPARDAGATVPIGRNAIFVGAPGQRDAAPAQGPFPLVVVMHGGLRAAPDAAAWIAAKLAQRGFVVAVVNPPHLDERDGGSAADEIWLRPKDFSAVLTAVLANPRLREWIDSGRVAALGFLRGGSAALALAGARIDPEAYARSCNRAEVDLDCDWFAKQGIDLRRTDPERVGGKLRDERIRAVVAVDPELAAVVSPASLATITVPVRIVNLGAPDAILPALDASSIAAVIPSARYDTIPDATRYSSFGLCQPRARAILKEEGGDTALCEETEQQRTVVHERLAALIEESLRQFLEPL